MVELAQAASRADIAVAKRLFEEYAASLHLDLSFQGFAAELAQLPGYYVPPLGALLLAREGEVVVGCVALRAFEPPEIAELKRLYVKPSARGKGLGVLLTKHVITIARAAGYRYLRLDTLGFMHSAQHIYEQLGFHDIAAYRYNPLESARYLELTL